ncbi:MAG: hypothetical protein JW725_03195 [Candidatus Babeliaceae bacterium]|nr:hypothetical protein [Candidatus Babeliaceae bacterium]
MRKILRLSLGSLALGIITAANASACCATSATPCYSGCAPKTILLPRGAEDLVVQTFRKGYFTDNPNCTWGNIDFEYKYRRSWNSCHIAESIFPSPVLSFVGSKVDNRETCDLVADYFGMATDTNLKLYLNPLIQYHICNIGITLGLNEIVDGLWIQLNAPVTHTKWELQHTCTDACSNKSPGCTIPCSTLLSKTQFNWGYMNHGTPPEHEPDEVPGIDPLPVLEDALSGKVFGDLYDSWYYGKFCNCDSGDTRVGIVDVKLGYNVIECPDYHVGIYFKFAGPTGTRIDCTHAACIFSPTIGNDHWQVGGGISAHTDLWNCDDCHTVTLYFEGYLTHFLRQCQARSFDFKNAGVMSRYMLLKVFEEDNTYSGRMINAINYTTRRVYVNVDLLGEGLLECAYKNECGLGASIGYNIYGRTKDKICRVCEPCYRETDNRVGFKGCEPIQPVGYLTTGTPGVDQVIDGVGAIEGIYNDTTSATRSNATAFYCGTTDGAVPLNVEDTTPTSGKGFVFLDPRVTEVITGGTQVDADHVTIANESASGGTLAISEAGEISGLTYAPHLLSPDDLDICSGEAPAIVTHKIFGKIDYTWSNCTWLPYVRCGAEVEFASKSRKGTMNMWGIFIGGGVSF